MCHAYESEEISDEDTRDISMNAAYEAVIEFNDARLAVILKHRRTAK